MNLNEQSPEVSSPTGFAFFACLVSTALLYVVARPVALVLHLWWARALVDSVIPLTIAFTILYCGGWHREMTRVARAFYMLWQSCLIFGGVLILAGVVIVTSAVFFNRFSAFHY